jgi:hypothetical protein
LSNEIHDALYEIQSPTEQKEPEECDAAIENKCGFPMDEADFKDDPDYADFVTPSYDCYEDDEVSASNIFMMSRAKMMLIHLTNMLEVRGYLLGMKSALGR